MLEYEITTERLDLRLKLRVVDFMFVMLSGNFEFLEFQNYELADRSYLDLSSHWTRSLEKD